MKNVKDEIIGQDEYYEEKFETDALEEIKRELMDRGEWWEENDNDDHFYVESEDVI
jgi:hypothetical protein